MDQPGQVKTTSLRPGRTDPYAVSLVRKSPLGRRLTLASQAPAPKVEKPAPMSQFPLASKALSWEDIL